MDKVADFWANLGIVILLVLILILLGKASVRVLNLGNVLEKLHENLLARRLVGLVIKTTPHTAWTALAPHRGESSVLRLVNWLLGSGTTRVVEDMGLLLLMLLMLLRLAISLRKVLLSLQSKPLGVTNFLLLRLVGSAIY